MKLPGIWVLVALAVAGCSTTSPPTQPDLAAPQAVPPPTMLVHFIDVGQGAATLFEFPCGVVLVDTGAQDQAHVDALVGYLKAVFQRRPDLEGTIDALFVTHPHIDHTRGIRAVCESFTVRNFIDDGITYGSGGAQVTWMRSNAGSTAMREVEQGECIPPAGLTDAVIDPVACMDCDPEVRVLAGRCDANPGWPQRAFDNANNHSLVVRIDFGEASVLVTGDLETQGIGSLLDRYQGADTLDVDVWTVGHHGSYNATTKPLLDALTPEIAVIQVGRWDFGLNGAGGNFTTNAYGHPRLACVELLEQAVIGTREPKTVKIGSAARTFQDRLVAKAIYATGWDGTVVLEAGRDGVFTVIAPISPSP